MLDRRIVILVGPYGSGKSEVALNLALKAADSRRPTALLDLDLVKPFLRSRSLREELKEKAIEVVAPEGENTFADLPILLPRCRALFRDPSTFVVADIGGDEAGSKVLGSISDALPAAETHLLLVLNFCRPFAESVEQAVALAARISSAARLSLTGVISNTHLKEETTPSVVREGYNLALEVAKILKIPVVAVTVDESLAPSLDPKDYVCPIFTLSGLLRLPFEIKVRKRGPLFVLS